MSDDYEIPQLVWWYYTNKDGKLKRETRHHLVDFDREAQTMCGRQIPYSKEHIEVYGNDILYYSDDKHLCKVCIAVNEKEKRLEKERAQRLAELKANTVEMVITMPPPGTVPGGPVVHITASKGRLSYISPTRGEVELGVTPLSDPVWLCIRCKAVATMRDGMPVRCACGSELFERSDGGGFAGVAA